MLTCYTCPDLASCGAHCLQYLPQWVRSHEQPMHVQREKSVAAYAEDRISLKEKLERLQKANKQRRQENTEMQDRFSAMHQRASAYDQVESPLLLCLHAASQSQTHRQICSRWAQDSEMKQQQQVMRLDICGRPCTMLRNCMLEAASSCRHSRSCSKRGRSWKSCRSWRQTTTLSLSSWQLLVPSSRTLRSSAPSTMQWRCALLRQWRLA